MARQKSSLKDTVINIVLLIVTGGVLAWRIHGCKEQERLAAEKVKTDAVQVEKAAKALQDRCLSVHGDRKDTSCAQCVCQSCGREVLDCEDDAKCKAMTAKDVASLTMTSTKTPAQWRFETRISCMFNKCAAQCMGDAGAKP